RAHPPARHGARGGDRHPGSRPRAPLHARGGRGRRPRQRLDPARGRRPVRHGRRDGHLDLARPRPGSGGRARADDDEVRRSRRRPGAGLGLARTAVFGGSFNPIHYGHLLLADEILETLELDRILFVPAAVPPHKSPAHLAPAGDRHEMVRLATAGHPKFEVSDAELRRSGPSYTVDTLEALRSPGEDLFLIVGSETFLDLLTWREPRRIAELRSEEHTSELQSLRHLVCRLLLEK